MLVGYREPALSNGRAAVLSVAIDGLFGNAPPDARLYRLPLGEVRGVRDLATFGDTVLILAGPATGDPDPLRSTDGTARARTCCCSTTLPRWSARTEHASRKRLLPLDASPSGLRVLILFYGEKEGAPLRITIPRP